MDDDVAAFVDAVRLIAATKCVSQGLSLLRLEGVEPSVSLAQRSRYVLLDSPSCLMPVSVLCQ
jgi:hypothetical protein